MAGILIQSLLQLISRKRRRLILLLIRDPKLLLPLLQLVILLPIPLHLPRKPLNNHQNILPILPGQIQRSNKLPAHIDRIARKFINLWPKDRQIEVNLIAVALL